MITTGIPPTPRRGAFRRGVSVVLAGALGLALSSCAQVLDPPLNAQIDTAPRFSPDSIPEGHGDGSLLLGLAFSGGGTRAAAYAYGILRQLQDTPVPGRPGTSMADKVRMVSGASGGAVTAAYFALKGPHRFDDLRERFLERDAESSLSTSIVSPATIAGALGGGINGRGTFARWLDENLFDGARYAAFDKPDKPIVWINASDIWNSTPFLFTHDTFAALCSDLNSLPISEAVAASAAVPMLFKPIPLKAYGPVCGYKRPAWLQKALDDPNVSMRVLADARALENYQNPSRLKYVKLLDGGLTDNFGLSGFTMNRMASDTPYGPLSIRQAVRLRTMLYLVADAGRREDIAWGETLRGPGAAQMVEATANTMVDASVRHEYDAMQLALASWRRELVAWRCSLSPAEVLRHRGSLKGWDCRDLEIIFDAVSFDDLTPPTQNSFRKVETRLVLPQDQVETSVAAGREALLRNHGFRTALKHVRTGTSRPAEGVGAASADAGAEVARAR